jgi:hypothetical protein
MKALNYLRKRNYQLWLEKLVVGVEEPIFIKGVGDILAKVDSGNGAFNVIHGEDFYYQGDVVVFTTYDENGKDHRVSKKVQDTITINIGAGQTEDRPVVLFDVKFATDEFLNVPFTVGNRSNNKNKVLLGQEFLKNELDALIDISKDNISDKKIEVDYTLKEEDTSTAMHGGNNFLPKSLKTNPSGATSTAGKAYQAAKGGIRGAYNIYKTLGNTDLSIGQGIDTLKKNLADAKKEIQDYQKDDKYLIFKYLNDKFMASGQPISPFVKDPQVYKILDYIGYTYENKQIGNKQNNSQGQSKDQNQEQNPEQQQSDSTEIVNSSYQENSFNLIKEETTFEKTQREQASVNKPILYLVLFDNNQKEAFKDFLRDNYPQAETDFNKIMSDIKSDFYSDTTKRLGRMLVDGLKSKGILTEFVLVSGVKGSRKVTPIAEAFEKSIFTEFLGERVINYIEELLTNSELSSVDEQGNFSSNPQFGFKKYRAVNGSTIATEGPVDSQIKRWIDSNKGGENPNIFAAFRKFNNYGTQNDKTSEKNNTSSENKGEGDSFGKTEGGTPPPQPESPNQGTEFDGEDYSSEKQSQASQDTKRLSDSSKKQRKAKQKTTKKEKYPKKAPDGFIPPKKSKRLNNGHYLWKDSTSGRFLEYDPETGMIYDALEWRRQRGQEENEENLLETTCSEFILNILFG